MLKEELKDIKTLYRDNRPDLIIKKVEYRIKTAKKIIEMIEETDALEERMEYLGLLGTYIEDRNSLAKTVKHFKKMYITMILRKLNWNITQSAKVLKLERTYLSTLIKQLGITKKRRTK